MWSFFNHLANSEKALDGRTTSQINSKTIIEKGVLEIKIINLPRRVFFFKTNEQCHGDRSKRLYVKVKSNIK
jgi:hypothetical protein